MGDEESAARRADFELEIAVEDPGWTAVLADPEAELDRAVAAILARAQAHEGAPAMPVLAAGRYALSLVLADDSLVADLNATWRGHAGPTNVLSFAAQAGAPPPTPASLAVPVLLGDVVLARQTVEREAAASAKSPRAHALHLVMHGVLHCLGFAHDDPDAAAEMETLEIEAMGDLGLENPYIDRQEDPNLAVAEDRGGEAGRDM